MEIAIAHTHTSGSAEAGKLLGEEIKSQMPCPVDAMVVFVSPRYDYEQLLQALNKTCEGTIIVGCSSAGEFTSEAPNTETACVLALSSPDMHFSASLGRDLKRDRKAAAKHIVSSFTGTKRQDYAYRSAMVLTDALAGFVDSFIEQINLESGGIYQLFGGGAGDDARFDRTHVFLGTKAYTDAAVVLEILSNKPIGIGVNHGWEPSSGTYRVTESEGSRLISLNAAPAIEAFEEHAEATGQTLDGEDPLPFFLSNVIGIESEGQYRLRVPLSTDREGAVVCAAEVPVGSIVRIMRASALSSAEAAEKATRSALSQLNNHKPKVAVFFDCVATRLRTGQDFGLELQALQDSLLPAKYIGCNTYGQIARAEGQFGGFHNCTAVIGIFPE